MTFEEWMQAVDRVLVGNCGLSSADMEDFCYRDFYDDAFTPEETANAVMEEMEYYDYV